MADLDLNELISVEHRKAFAAMWANEKDAAKAEVRRLLDLVSNPAEHLSDTQNLVRRIFLGLVGEVPDLETWLQAVAVGSLRLRNDQRYVIMRANEKPARFLERGLKTYDEGVSPRQRSAGITDAGVKEGMHLIAFLIIAKELKNLASGPAALGPAWPLMVAIDTYLTNQEKRALHAAGANEQLQRALADAVKAALAAYVSERDPATTREGRAASWSRELPPETDVRGYFARKGGLVADAASNDPRQVEEIILRGPRPSFLPMDPKDSSAELPIKLSMLLSPRAVSVDFTSKAYRALARRDAREAEIKSKSAELYTDDFRVQVWLCDWARRGGGVTSDLPAIYFVYLEEEACLAYATLEESWDGTRLWRSYGVISEDVCFEPPEVTWSSRKKDVAMTWIDPPQ